MSEIKQFCTFYLEGNLYGIEVIEVQEVLRDQVMTKVPLASAVVSGMLNLRGNIVPTIHMRNRFSLPFAEPTDKEAYVVAKVDGGLVSLFVDRIGEVVNVTSENFERTPNNLDPAINPMIRGVYKLKECLVMALDLEQVMNFEVAAC